MKKMFFILPVIFLAACTGDSKALDSTNPVAIAGVEWCKKLGGDLLTDGYGKPPTLGKAAITSAIPMFYCNKDNRIIDYMTVEQAEKISKGIKISD